MIYLEFIFAGFWRFIGCLVLLGTVGSIIVGAIAAARGKMTVKVEKEDDKA